MRKRYSRSYTVLSFLTMFSYRELPSPLFLHISSGKYCILYSIEKIPELIRGPMALFGFDDTDNLKGTVFPFL